MELQYFYFFLDGMALMYCCMVACIHSLLCLYLIPSPADYAARSCPDVWKWLGRPQGLPVSGIWAPPYYFNHFRSSRLESRSVIHRGSYIFETVSGGLA